MLKRACRLPAIIIIALVVIITLLGCQQKVNPEVTEVQHNGSVGPISPPDLEQDAEHKQNESIEISSNDATANDPSVSEPYDPTLNHQQEVDTTIQEEDGDAQQSSHNEVEGMDELSEDTHTEVSNDTDTQSEGSKVDDIDRFYLLGMYVNQPMSEIVAQLPKPDDQFTMPDIHGTLTIYDYNEFMIGFSEAKRVVFIDVFSEGLDTGVPGVQVGALANDAVQSLGQAQSRSEFVLNFVKGNTILKLDLDPVSQRILSIKLFADS